MKFFKKLGLLVLFLFAGCATSTVYEDQVLIFDAKEKQYISLSMFIQRLQDKDVVLLGEQHNRRQDHVAHQYIAQHLPRLQTIVLEMLPSEVNQESFVQAQQQYRQNKISASHLKSAMQWNDEWDWSMYKDFVLGAIQQSWQLKGGNLSRPEIVQIFQGAEPLKGHYSTSDLVKEKISALITQYHEVESSKLAAMVQAQLFKDRRMAETLKHSDKPVMLKAGNIHVRKDVGVPLHLRDYQESSVVSVVFQKDKVDSDFSQADYVWVWK